MSGTINPSRLAQIARWGRVLRDTIDPADYSGPEEHVARAIINAGPAILDLLNERAALLAKIEALEAADGPDCHHCGEGINVGVCSYRKDHVCDDCAQEGMCPDCFDEDLLDEDTEDTGDDESRDPRAGAEE